MPFNITVMLLGVDYQIVVYVFYIRIWPVLLGKNIVRNNKSLQFCRLLGVIRIYFINS